MNPVLPNPFYYLENFHQVLSWIGERYDDLLNEEERVFLRAFPALPQASRALFVRMVMRKGTLFRASKLAYAEIGDAHEAALPLAELGLIEHDPALTLDELFELLQKGEISQAFQLGAQEKSLRKAEQLEALRPRHGGAQRYSSWCRNFPDGAGHAYRILA